MEFGLYYINAAGGSKTYQPLLVDLVPAQTGPTGHWYMDNKCEATMKYEDLKIEKFINSQKNDIVHFGEIVHFNVEVQLPHYDNTSSTYVAAFDDMEQAFKLLSASASLTYYDANGVKYHPMTTGLVTDTYGNVTVSDVNRTYTAKLCETAVPFFIEGDDNNLIFYATPANDGLYQFWAVINGSLVEVNQGLLDDPTTLSESLDVTNDKRRVAGLSQFPAGRVVQAPYTKSLISITFDYSKLMNPDTYIKDALHDQEYKAEGYNTSFIVPEGMYVSYDAVVTDQAYIGDVDQYSRNTNTVTLFYQDDPTGHIGVVKDEVQAWTYRTDIVKVDGDLYETFNPENAIEPLTNPDPYLEGAVFSIYRLDSIYCGSSTIGDLYGGQITNGTVLTTAPGSADFSKYYFLNDTFGYDTYASARTAWIGKLAKDIQYEYTVNKKVFDPATIKTAVATYLGATDGAVDGHNIDHYMTANTFANKYNKIPNSEETLEILKNWIIPGAKNTGVEYQLIPVEVESCANCASPHYHVEAYMIFFDNVVSTGTAEGVKMVGFDDTSYLLIEKQAPAATDGGAYNVMDQAMKYSFIKNKRADGTYAGFKDDEDKVRDDGIYDLLVSNYKGLTLPSTGGMGTLLFTVIGIVLMMSVMAILLMKKRKAAKYATGVFALMLALACTFGNTGIKAHAVTTVSLSEGNSTMVSGEGTTSIQVNLKEGKDTIEVYRIAPVTWDEANKIYKAPAWPSIISTRIPVIATALGVDSNLIKDPITLGKQDTSVQEAFLNWLYENRDSNALSSLKVDSSDISIDEEGKIATVSNLKYGIYLIKGKNTMLNRNYGIITANAFPTRTGPGTEWFIDNNLIVSLKFSDINVKKTINGKASETVTIGDQVEFVIDGDVPEYPAVDADGNVLTDPELIASYDFSNYVFNLVDDMDDAFSYLDGSLKIEGSKNGTDYSAIDTSYYRSVFTTKAAATEAASGIMVYEDNIRDGKNYVYANVDYNAETEQYSVDWYSYNRETGELTLLGHTNAKPSASVDDSAVTDIGTKYNEATKLESNGVFTRVASTEWKDLRAVSFDYEKLKQAGITKIKVSYSAIITDEIKVGSQENYNTALLYYQADLSGKVVPKTSTVHAYAYAVQIMKVDGEKNTPLKGARFILFQDVYTYVPSVETVLDPSVASGYGNFKFVQNATGDNTIVAEAEAAPTIEYGTEEAPDSVTIDTLDKLNAKNNGNRYYYRYIEVPEGETPYGTMCGVEAAAIAEPRTSPLHYHIEVYEALKLGEGEKPYEFESIESASGVIIKGLAARNYALIETKAPDGYNILTEAVLFKVQELSDEQATSLMGDKDNLAGFLSDVEIAEKDLPHALDYITITTGEGEDAVTKYFQAYKNGTYPITIKNYAGIKLPNTGGMGTMLFTVIGIAMMMAVLVLLLAKNRRKEQY